MNRVLLEKLIVDQLVKRFPTVYGTLRFFRVPYRMTMMISQAWAK
jgi:hypothetical protein